ncbi:hypothetical protein [Amphritea sp.]|uniref:hypothetical protein n=1 Tax=Amphritea sp. TaxID=1872502 RepID=UPI003A93C423
MDAFFKSRCTWLIVRYLKIPIAVYRKRHCVLLLLVGSLLLPGIAGADVLSDSYERFILSLGKLISQPLSDGVGTELKSIVVEYRNQPVSFQYQLWQLRPNSVCLPLKGDLLDYSACTEAASQFFRETCQTLAQHPNRTPDYSNYKRLYCDAAASYQPVVAKVNRATEIDEEAKQRQRCAMLTIKAARTHKNIDVYERDKVCGGP